MKEPDAIKYTAESYSKIINDYINRNGNQTFELKFSYCTTKKKYTKGFYSYEYDTNYIDYLSCVVDGLKNGSYDMILLDERHLFTEVSLIENFLLGKFLKYRQLHTEYENLIRYNIDTSYHNSDILSHGRLGSNIYGIPYEMDFDVMYSQDIKNEFSNDTSWDELLNQATNSTKYSRPINIPIGDNDELLNFFAEYTSEQYNLLEQKKKNSHYFDIFYNEKSNDLFNSFRDYIVTKTKLDTKLSMEQSVDSFINNESKFFKGKASQYSYLKSKTNQTISIELPPKQYSVITEKYLVFNIRFKDKTILEDVAKKLTSKDIQQFRAEQFGSIPTFDIKQKETDPIIKQYCDTHSEICHLLEWIKPIRIKDFFKKDKLSASFLEVRIYIPEILKNFLNDGKLDMVQKTFQNTVEIRLTSLKELNPYSITLFVIMVISSLATFVVMYYVYKYRKHSQLKDLSPSFCNLIIIGFIMCYFLPIFLIQNESIVKCKIFFYYSIVCCYLIILPMFMITFRVYYIYTHTRRSKVVIGKKLSDKRLSIIITIILSVIITSNLLFAFMNNFYLGTIPSINTFRYCMCFHDNYIIYNLFATTFNLSIIICIVYMTVKLGHKSHKYGRFNFIYIIFLIVIEEHILRIIIGFIINHYSIWLIIVSIFNIAICTLCIYILIGKRLVFIIKHPEDRGDYIDSINITQFISLNKEERKIYSKANRVRHHRTKSKNSKITDEVDLITSNPNNVFFNRSLKMLNQQQQQNEKKKIEEKETNSKQ